MSSKKLIPASPDTVSVIRQVTPNITTVSAPFLRFGLIKVGGRGTIVRMTNGSLAVFSPTALTPTVRSTIDSMGGRVGYITATDIEHHIFISEWAKAFPTAKVFGPEGLPEKRAKNPETAGVDFSHVWTKANKTSVKIDPDFDHDFDHEFVDGHGNKELVFNFRPDRTLIQADLIFNLPATEQFSRSGESATSGFFTKLFGSLMNTRGQALPQRRFVYHLISSNDRKSFNASIQRIRGWDFDRIIPCHGDVIETGGKGLFEKMFQWHF